MIFIGLVKFRKKPTKESAREAGEKLQSQFQKQRVKILGWYWTLGRYDAVIITEGPDEGAVERTMKTSITFSDIAAIETLVALKREDAVKLLD